MLVKFVEDKREEWDTVLDCCIFAYNTSKHASSLYPPFEIMYGRKAVLPVEFSAKEDKKTRRTSGSSCKHLHVYVTGFVKTGPNHTRTEIRFTA